MLDIPEASPPVLPDSLLTVLLLAPCRSSTSGYVWAIGTPVKNPWLSRRPSRRERELRDSLSGRIACQAPQSTHSARLPTVPLSSLHHNHQHHHRRCCCCYYQDSGPSTTPDRCGAPFLTLSLLPVVQDNDNTSLLVNSEISCPPLLL